MNFIEINGKTYPMHYGHSAIKNLSERAGIKGIIQMEELIKNLSFDDMPFFVKAGFDTGAKIAGSKPPFSEEQVELLLEEHFWLETEAIRTLGDCINRPGEAEDEADEGDKPTEGNG